MENVNMNDDFMKLMKNQQDMIQNQQAQINALLEMQQSHKIVDEQRDIPDISGVTEVTIRNRYKEIISELGIVLD